MPGVTIARQRNRKSGTLPVRAESDGSRTGFRRKPDSVPMIADSR